MKIHIELTEKEVRKLVLHRLQELGGDLSINDTDVQIEVKSKQNYNSEWEQAEFRAQVNKVIP